MIRLLKQLLDHFQAALNGLAAAARVLDGQVDDAPRIIGNGLLEDGSGTLDAGLSAAEVNIDCRAEIRMTKRVREKGVEQLDGVSVGHAAAGLLRDGHYAIHVRKFLARIDFAHGSRSDFMRFGRRAHAGRHHAHEIPRANGPVRADIPVERERGELRVNGRGLAMVAVTDGQSRQAVFEIGFVNGLARLYRPRRQADGVAERNKSLALRDRPDGKTLAAQDAPGNRDHGAMAQKFAASIEEVRRHDRDVVFFRPDDDGDIFKCLDFRHTLILHRKKAWSRHQEQCSARLRLR